MEHKRKKSGNKKQKNEAKEHCVRKLSNFQSLPNDSTTEDVIKLKNMFQLFE